MRHNNLLPGTQLTVGNSISEQTLLSNEEGLRAHVFLELNPAVKGVVNKLGVQGRFDLPGAGNVTVVGNPDFSWIQGDGKMHPKLVVCPSISPKLMGTTDVLINPRRSIKRIGWLILMICPPSFQKSKSTRKHE